MASPLSSTPASVFRSLRDASLFCILGALTCAAIHQALPFPHPPGIYQKYLHFAEHRDEYDALFLGSSRFYHHIIPRRFDAAIASTTGRNLRSFNFGYDAMWPPESYFILRKILALRPARLRWVFIDMMNIDPKLNEQYTGTMRMAYWHDWRHTRMAFTEILQSDEASPTRLRMLSDHAGLFLKEALNFGRGADWLGERLSWKKKDWGPPKEWRETEGYKAGQEKSLPESEREEYDSRVSALTTSPPKPRLSPPFRSAMSELIAEVRAAGAQPIFVLAPTLLEREFFAAPPDAAHFIPFNDPLLFPQLYDPAMRYDSMHLNPRGAEIFTDLLAGRSAPLLQAAP